MCIRDRVNRQLSLLVEENAKVGQEVEMVKIEGRDRLALIVEDLKRLRDEVYMQRASIRDLSVLVYELDERFRRLEEKLLAELESLKLLTIHSASKVEETGENSSRPSMH